MRIIVLTCLLLIPFMVVLRNAVFIVVPCVVNEVYASLTWTLESLTATARRAILVMLVMRREKTRLKALRILL